MRLRQRKRNYHKPMNTCAFLWCMCVDTRNNPVQLVNIYSHTANVCTHFIKQLRSTYTTRTHCEENRGRLRVINIWWLASYTAKGGKRNKQWSEYCNWSVCLSLWDMRYASNYAGRVASLPQQITRFLLQSLKLGTDVTYRWWKKPCTNWDV